MPLSKRDVEEIKKRRAETHRILLDFFKEHSGEYFTKEEIAEKTSISENELEDELLSMVLRLDYGDVEMIEEEHGRIYFGRKVEIGGEVKEMDRVTHKINVEFYASLPQMSEEDVRNWMIGYLEGKLPKLDIENITVKKVE